jgi:hypothetical protein
VKNRTIQFLIYRLIILSVGCATAQKFYVDIDSISSTETELKKRYILLSGLKNIEVGDLQFKEYAQYVERALTSKGFVKANNLEEANVAIFLAYGIGDPQKHVYSYSLPIWGQTGVSSSTTYGTINTFGSTATYSGWTTYTPKYGVTGFMPIVGSYVTHFRFLILDAVDLDEYKRSQKVVQLWQTIITSTGSSDDLRRVFPILVAASKPYIGTNTSRKVKIVLSENDVKVLEIKGINKQEKQ